MIQFSRGLAIFLGVVTPLLETYRRWGTWQDDPAAFFDDYLLAGLLLLGAWQTGRNALTGQKYLTAGWGFALAMVYGSFFFQFALIDKVANDPSGFSTVTAVTVKGVGFALILIGFVTSFAKIKEDKE